MSPLFCRSLNTWTPAEQRHLDQCLPRNIICPKNNLPYMSIAVSQMLIAYKSTLENSETLKQPAPTAQIPTTKCHVDQLKGKDNPCSTLATQASHTKQRSSTKVEYNKQNSTPSHEHIRKRCLTNMETSAPDATSPQQHTIKQQISNIEQQNFAPIKMQPHKSEHKKGQQMDSFKQHNLNAHSTKQQNPNLEPHTSKSQLQPLRQQTTPSSRHAPQTSHSSHSNLNLADAMARAKVLDIDLQKQLRPYMQDMLPLPGVFDPDFVAANQGERANNIIKGSKKEQVQQIVQDIRSLAAFLQSTCLSIQT
ncbi:uncharacterized protein LOC131073666 isoform X1 [Cryptomeria japonica]|uniref:uncharacterized protein LOC131073666 isoform X1 n=1 Tax=Cryptomeria japonica TaxID=3369 RepID=UPI0027DAB30D|nr:uncharacterized protein LOC131073666 isoform X1 [Cryptomeria japonica]